MPPSINDGSHGRIGWLRAQAEEARTMGERMRYPAARDTMLRLADTFDNVAERLERMGRRQITEDT